LLDRRPGLKRLLVQFGRFDFRQQLPRPHAVSDIGVAPLEVTVRAGQDRRFGDRLGGSRQDQPGNRRRAPDRRYPDNGQRCAAVLRLRDDLGLAVLARQVAQGEDCRQRHNEQQQPDAKRPPGRPPRRFAGLDPQLPEFLFQLFDMRPKILHS
jgi:hypothetical protein